MSNIMHFISNARDGRFYLWPHDAATFDLDVHPPLKLVTRRTRDGNGSLLWMRSLRINCSLYCCTRQIGHFWPVAQTLYFLLASSRACSSSNKANNYRCATTIELVGIVRASR